jgi:hypothetical protein
MDTPPGWGLEHRARNPVSVKKFNRYRNLNNCKVANLHKYADIKGSSLFTLRFKFVEAVPWTGTKVN